eukprot:827501-Pelagomonas_calceolata.AAC.1
MGIRVTSSSACLISVMRGERSLLKSASGANVFISVLDGISMKLQSKLPSRGYKTENANGDLESYWKHPAIEPGCEKNLCFQ